MENKNQTHLNLKPKIILNYNILMDHVFKIFSLKRANFQKIIELKGFKEITKTMNLIFCDGPSVAIMLKRAILKKSFSYLKLNICLLYIYSLLGYGFELGT